MPTTIHEFATEADWLKARLLHFTASDAALLMGSEKHREWALKDNPGVDPVVTMWRRKVSRELDERSPSIAARMGLALEPLVLTLYGELTGHAATRPYGHGAANMKYGMHVLPFGNTGTRHGGAAASLDAMTVDKNGAPRIVDAKTGMYGKGNFAATYEWPSRWQMFVGDCDFVDLACLHKAKAEFWVETVERDRDAESRMVTAATEFMDFVRRKVEPPSDWIAAQGSEF